MIATFIISVLHVTSITTCYIMKPCASEANTVWFHQTAPSILMSPLYQGTQFVPMKKQDKRNYNI